MSLKKAADCVKKHKNFLITTHTNSEGDALGSELAFYRLLKAIGKKAVIVNDDNAPYEYNFLPGIDKIKKFKEALKGIKFDCFVTLDCSSLTRCGQVHKLNHDSKTILNIDHHISNERFGDINWVDAHASSCSEMVYKIYKKLRIPLDKDIATSLYTGILTDTGSFHYPNTSGLTHKIVAQLLKYNLDIARIYKNAYENIPFSNMQLLTKILPAVKRQCKGRVVWFEIRRNMLKNQKLAFDLTENVLSFARAIKDVEVAVLFKENLGVKDEIRVNFRSQGKVDVNKIAAYFGGGGHKTASGATVKGRIDAVRRKVLAKIKEALS